MADVRYEVKLWQTDGTVFSGVNEAGAAVRLRSSTSAGGDGGEYTGNVAGSGDFTDRLQGLWSINIDSGDSGYYLIESYTTAAGAWSSVNGFAPVYIPLEDMLPLSGGTMTGDIAMGDNSVTGLDTITFTDTAGTIAGIQNQNLVDKADDEDLTGDWTCAGFFDITKDKLKIGGVAVTITAAEANMLDGLTTTSKIMTMDTSMADRTTAYTDTDSPHQLTYALTGYIQVNTAGGAVQLTLPALTTDNIGAEYIIDLTSAGNDLTVVRSSADTFVFMTADDTQITGTTITMSSAKDVLNIKAINAYYWLIIGGFGVDGLS